MTDYLVTKPDDWAAWSEPRKWKNPGYYYTFTGGRRPLKEYTAWQNMYRRAQGIVCSTTMSKKTLERANNKYRELIHDKELLKSYDVFLKELGPQPTPNHTVDRIDNSLGYQIGNIRWATFATQAFNKDSVGASNYRGVSWQTRGARWRAVLRLPQKRNIQVGYFKTELEAARAYDRASWEWFGDLSRLNFPEEVQRANND